MSWWLTSAGRVWLRRVVYDGACVRSDEELEDYKALLYLPIAPEVEDPEENPFGPPPDAAGQNATADDGSAHSGPGDKKQRQPSADGGPPKKKIRTTTIELQGVPSDGERRSSASARDEFTRLTSVSVFLSEVHPLLGVKGDSKSKKKAAGRPKGSKGKDKDSPFRSKVCRDRAEGLGTPGKTPAATFDPWVRCGLSSAVIGRVYFLLAFLSLLL